MKTEAAISPQTATCPQEAPPSATQESIQRFLSKYPVFEYLIDSTPALLLCLAESDDLLPEGKVMPTCGVEALATWKQKELAALFGFPEAFWSVKLLRKLKGQTLCTWNIAKLRQLAWMPEFVRYLQHQNEIHERFLSLMNHRWGFSVMHPRIVETSKLPIVSHAIQNHNFRPDRYYMINAAVPVEAYDYDSIVRDMVEANWLTRFDDGHERIFSATWHLLFNEPDNRSLLRWRNAFVDVSQFTALHNFFSPGEDVLAEQNGTHSASVISTILSQGFNFSRGTWKAQELVKGKSWWSTQGITAFMSRTQAGWDLRYLINPDPATLTDQDLRETPYFDDFREDDLTDTDPVIASLKAGETKVRYDLLARGIPALSYAAAVMPLPQPQSGATVSNWDLEAVGRVQSSWPTEGHTGAAAGDWIHSDFRNVALPYVAPMYQIMINQGSLYED